jgi:hypothetical protein
VNMIRLTNFCEEMQLSVVSLPLFH